MGLHGSSAIATSSIFNNCVKTQRLQYLLLLKDKQKLADFKADSLPHSCPTMLPSYTSRDRARVLFLHNDERARRKPNHRT